MKLLCVWLLVTFYVSVTTSANVVRSKRDLLRIQNFFKWLFGSNQIITGQVTPSDNSDSLEEEIYITPSYENIYFRTEPWMVNLDPHLYAEVPYPRLRQIESNRYFQRHYNEPIIRNYPPQIIQEFSVRDYDNEKLMYSVDRKRPLCRDVGAPLYFDITEAQEACVYDDSNAIITLTRQPLPRPPLYIQNRMREIILDQRIPSVTVRNLGGRNSHKNEIVMPSPQLQNVEIHEYPPQDNLPEKDETIQAPLERSQQLKSVLSQDVRINNFQLNPSVETEKKVHFTRPVHSSYSYKMLYHNQPHKNVIVKMENTHDVGVQNGKPTELPIVNTARVNSPLMTAESVSRVVSSDKRFSFTNQSNDMSDLQFSDTDNVAGEERTMNQRKVKTSARVNDRGDIPNISL